MLFVHRNKSLLERQICWINNILLSQPLLVECLSEWLFYFINFSNVLVSVHFKDCCILPLLKDRSKYKESQIEYIWLSKSTFSKIFSISRHWIKILTTSTCAGTLEVLGPIGTLTNTRHWTTYTGIVAILILPCCICISVIWVFCHRT